MRFRAALLTFSFVIIGFCLTLYFQSEQAVPTMNWDQYTNLQHNEERSYSLKDLNEKLLPYELVEVIREAFERNKLAGQKTRVMEIGAGDGRVIMELKKQLPDVEYYAINKEKTHNFYRRESFLLTALKYDIFHKTELNDLELPYLVFQDVSLGQRIPYAEGKFDVIYSQHTLRTIKYKFELFSEIMRVLKPGGISLHTDLPTINVYDKGVVMPFRDAIAEIRKRGVDVKLLENPRTFLFKKELENLLFPLEPHHPVPENPESVTQELRKPEMGYNLKY